MWDWPPDHLHRLLELAKSLPEGEIWNKFFDELSALDSIGDVMRQALDSAK